MEHKSPAEIRHLSEAQQRSRSWYIAGFIIGLLLFIPSFIISLHHSLTGFEARIFYDINNWPNAFKTPALWITEGLGAGYPIAACVLIPILFKRFRLAWRFFFTVGGAGIVMEIVKLIVKEPRPVVLLHGQLHERAIETGLNSYPSGHMVVATAMAMILWMILPKTWKWLSLVWIALVGISRIYLGVHTPLDVIGGVAIGMMAVSFVQLLPFSIAKWLRLDNQKPVLAEGWEGLDISKPSKTKVSDSQ